ncbi:hypothetical protein LC087_16840 [Bacillus carboniphilus]|uniref:DUF3888 domain-containing protein n=1 Tax=Bacillus carboniphilus TaxID=86663 RepID=A0ABY9JSH5_9BACI|nr:hypothetical protein [Bacillus carboniphilus]WLR42352.1 hypothetical protein LC087_16840 [Bacillus carboniphilus]
MTSVKKLLFVSMILIIPDSIISFSDQKKEIIEDIKLNGRTIETISIANVRGSMDDVAEPHITYLQIDTTEIQLFVEFIKRAEPIDGVVDVIVLDYVLTITYDNRIEPMIHTPYGWMRMGEL